jgi:hypothetical protein
MSNDQLDDLSVDPRFEAAVRALRFHHVNPAELDRLVQPFTRNMNLRALSHLSICPLCRSHLSARIGEIVLDQQGETENGAPLIQFLQHEEPSLRAAATQAAAKLAFESPAVRNAIIAGLTDLNVDVRRAAAEAAADLGLDAAAPVLAACLQDTEVPVRAAAASALGKLGVTSAEALASLVATLGDAATVVQKAAVDALTTIGLSARGVAERVRGELLTLLPDADPAIAAAARRGISLVMSRELADLFEPQHLRFGLAGLQGAKPPQPYRSTSSNSGLALSIREGAADSIVVHVACRGVGLDSFGIEFFADDWALERSEPLTRSASAGLQDWFEASIVISAGERRLIPVNAVLSARVVPLPTAT